MSERTGTASGLPTAADGAPEGKPGGFLGKLKPRQLGALPVILGLIIVWVTFQSLNDRFLSPENLFNLSRQISYGGVVSLGLVMMLLIREIDLSVGSVVGLSGAILAVLSVNLGWHPLLAIAATVGVGLVLGFVQGLIRTIFRVPSFLVTLGGFLIFFGLQLRVLGSTGSIQFPFGGLVSQIETNTLPATISYVGGAILVAFYAAVLVIERSRYLRAQLPTHGWMQTVLRIAVAPLVVFLTIWELNKAEGVPIALIIFVGLLSVFWVATRQTTYGQRIYAIGGNPAAAIRAGINVTAIRLSVFSLCGALAAFGGVLSGSYIGGANIQLGGSTLLLYAIAAAVIGGTSLFGGYGSVWAALLGWLVIGSIYNGMFLLNLTADFQSMMIGSVLIIAVIIDAVSRRREIRTEE